MVSFTAPANGGSPITNYTATCTSSNGGTHGLARRQRIADRRHRADQRQDVHVHGRRQQRKRRQRTVAGLVNAVVPAGVPDAPGQPERRRRQRLDQRELHRSVRRRQRDHRATARRAPRRTAAPPGATPTPASPINVTGLTNGKTYTCTVTATNGNGTSPASPASNAGRAEHRSRAAPGKPTVAADDAQITVDVRRAFRRRERHHQLHRDLHVVERRDCRAPTPGGGSPIVVTGLDNGKTYTCTVVRHQRQRRRSRRRRHRTPPIPNRGPDAPAQPSVSAGNGQITVTFTAPFNGGSAITELRRDLHVVRTAGRPGTTSGTGSPIVVTGLDNGKTYTCTVTATNKNGTSPPSAASGSAEPQTVPSAPAKPTVAAADGQITVSFSAPFDGGNPITSYTATCTSSNGGTSGTNTGGGSPITVSGLDDAKTYTCTVFATNGNGDGPASPASATAVPHRAPDAPAKPTVAPANAQVVVTFVAPFNGGSPITSYTANCTSSNGGVAGSNTGTSSPITVTGLTDFKSYTCTVTATNADGTSPLVARVGGGHSRSLPGRTGATDHRSTNARIIVAFVAPFNGGSPITGYTAKCTSSNGGVTGTKAGTGSPIAGHRAHERQEVHVHRHRRERGRDRPASKAVPRPTSRAPFPRHRPDPRSRGRQRVHQGGVRRARQRRGRDHRLHRGVLVDRRRTRPRPRRARPRPCSCWA